MAVADRIEPGSSVVAAPASGPARRWRRQRTTRPSGGGPRPPRGMGWPIALSVLPGLTLFLTFFLVPLGMLLVTSFADWSALGISFLGLDNFQQMVEDPTFWKAARNSTLYCAAAVFIQVPLGCAIGIILAQQIRGWRLFRTIIFIPFVISGAAYAIIFSLFYNPRYGLLDSMLGLVGLDGRDWLFSTDTALLAVAGTYVFNIGFIVVLVMAEIASIPRELYEAAEVDGASPLARQWHITVPLLRNVVGTVVLITLLIYLAFFDVVYILTRGGPADSTLTLTLYAYRAYANSQWGYASAVGIFIVLVGLVAIVGVRRLFRIGQRTL